jgi:hypothetical protein
MIGFFEPGPNAVLNHLFLSCSDTELFSQAQVILYIWTPEMAISKMTKAKAASSKDTYTIWFRFLNVWDIGVIVLWL